MRKRVVGEIVSLFLAVLMLPACLTASGCASAEEPEIIYKNVPAEHQSLFHDGYFEWGSIWMTEDERYAALAAELSRFCDEQMCGSVVVATDDKVIFAGGFGDLEADGQTPVSPFTTYEIGSVTKQFTAAAILREVQAGRLDVNDTLDKYFPDYPLGGQITVDNLLRMDSGISDYTDEEFYRGDAQKLQDFHDGLLSDEQLLEYLYGRKLAAEPGSTMYYSNTNYWLLAQILEQVTGQSFEEYLSRNIFEVCAMTESACIRKDVEHAEAVSSGGKYMVNGESARGAGDIRSNCCDVLLWERALFGGKIIGEEQLAYMTGFRKGYSCGWVDLGKGNMYHEGNSGNFISYVCVLKAPDGENVYVIQMISDMMGRYAPEHVNEITESYLRNAALGADDGETAGQTTQAGFPNVPAEYQDLFHGGSFDEDNIWATDDENYTELMKAIRELCDKYFNGSLMLATDDKVIFAGGWDAVEVDGVTTVNPFTTYEIGSITKQFCAAAVLQQVQAGKIDVNETIDKYFPEYPYGGQITVEQLLYMDSGIPDMINDYKLGKFFSVTEENYNGKVSDEEMLKIIGEHELNFTPTAGEEYIYSNTNYWLLAQILEQVTGQSYREYVQQNIFDVCDMPCSSSCETGNLTSAPELGSGYTMYAESWRGAGDIHSSVCDLLRWNRTLFAGRLLDGEQMEYMLSFRGGYSCGWMEMADGSIAHGGNTQGYHCENRVFRTSDGENLYFIMMSGNRGKASFFEDRAFDIINRNLP